jgi:hypothetical protein
VSLACSSPKRRRESVRCFAGILEELKKFLLPRFLQHEVAKHVQLSLVLSTNAFFLSGYVVETRVLSGARSTFGKLRMLLRDEFLTPLRYYK